MILPNESRLLPPELLKPRHAPVQEKYNEYREKDHRLSDEKARELFTTYFSVGIVIDGIARIRIDSMNLETLVAYGTVVDEDADGFFNNEVVKFKPYGGEIWRVISDRNDHGHAVFVGEDYGGISIGS